MKTTPLKITLGQHSDAGTKADNEDFYGYAEPAEPQLTLKGASAVIADGMSGSDAGKKASHACVIGFLSDYYSTPESWSVVKSCQQILSATNTWLYSQGQSQYQSNKGMVSTLSILILKSNTAHIFHIGDSRIYRLRDNTLEQLTRDHRVWISDEKNYLTRAMGIEPRLEVDHRSTTLLKDDLFILTTDGVHDFINDKTIKKIVNKHNTPQEAADQLIKTASANHSDDNLTCQVLRIDSLPTVAKDEILKQHKNLPFPPFLDPGMILDGYRIEKELHANKRTQIYQAYDTLTDTPVILKSPSVLYDDDPHYIEHFLHEEWAGKRVNHKNLLTILESDRPKSCIYYVTEFLEGITLRDWITKHPKPAIEEVIQIIKQIIHGLHAMHHMEMLHQDLKPENIMIDNTGAVKIIDFGSVKIAGIEEITPLELHQENNLLGTLNYTAPEYHLNHRGAVNSDLYSLGVITYEMLTGSLPFGKDMPEKPNKINLSKLNYVSSFHHNPMIPTWIDGALRKATAINPQIRYKDLSEFIYDLSHPNAQFLVGPKSTPLIERNPLVFWKTIAGILLISNLILGYFLSTP